MSRRTGLGWPRDPATSSAFEGLGWPSVSPSNTVEGEVADTTNVAFASGPDVSRETPEPMLVASPTDTVDAPRGPEVREGATAPPSDASTAADASKAIDVSDVLDPQEDQTVEPPSKVAPPVSRETSSERARVTRIITVANQKGGVGKTTTTVNVAAALAQAGERVLVVDLDPQGNASTALGISHAEGTEGVYEVLIESQPLDGVVQKATSIDGVWCIPSTVDVAGCEIELVSLEDREFRLRTALRNHAHVEHYDFILIDCPPSLGLLTINAFTAATEVLIPIQCEYYALEGLTQLMRNITLIQKHLNPRLRVSTILMTMYDARTRLSAQVAAEVRSHFGDLVLKTSVPRSVRISEAPSHGETVLTYDPISVGALSYREVAVELTRQHLPQDL